MARRKKKQTNLEDLNISEGLNSEELIENIAELIEEQITKEFGAYEDPELLIVKTNIKPLDAVLGGGLVLGMPVMVTGAAEIGKTTIAWQMIKNLLEQYPTSLALYIDVEGSANSQNEELGIKSRIELMNINKKRVIYKSMTLSIEGVFKLIDKTVKFKQQLEEKRNIQIPMIVVWDSIADTDPEKIEDVEDPNKLVGYKARLVQFMLGKYKPLFRHNQVMLYLIDQVRANISDGMAMYQKQEKQVGQVNNLKSATGSKAVEHKLRQWLFLSQGPEIYDKPGILGWYLDVHVVKSKLAPSGFTIRTVFDKRYGINKFWTEYHFISNLTPFEEKIYKKLGGQQNSKAREFKSNIESMLGIISKGAYKYLQYVDPETGEVILSDSFYEKDALDKYNNDPKFRELFDKIVDMHVKERIIKHFNPNNVFEVNVKELLAEESETIEQTSLADTLPDPETIGM